MFLPGIGIGICIGGERWIVLLLVISFTFPALSLSEPRVEEAPEVLHLEPGSQWSRGLSGSREILGDLVSTTSDYNSVVLPCYHGFGFLGSRCMWTDIGASAGLLVGDQLSGASYLNWFYSGLDQQFCLECCDRTRVLYNQQQTLLMECEHRAGDNVPVDDLDTFFNTHEFVFAQRKSYPDMVDKVSCALQRKGDAASQQSLVGYSLTLYVTEYSTLLNYWRGVSGCNATGIYNASHVFNTNFGTFTENITLVVGGANRSLAPSRLQLLLTLLTIACLTF